MFRLIEDKDFLQLATLVVDMYKSIKGTINPFQAVNTLMSFIYSGKDFTALGVYEGDRLVGFSCGHAISEETFLFTGIYLTTKGTELTSEFITYSLDFIKEKGYKSWEADATNKNISSILEKFGALAQFVRYKKDY